MKHFTVKASVTVDVEMTINAETAGMAKKLFEDNVMMTANLVDIDAGVFQVHEESISEIDRIKVVAD